MEEPGARSNHYKLFQQAGSPLYEGFFFTVLEPHSAIRDVEDLTRHGMFPPSFRVSDWGNGIPRDLSHFSEEANTALSHAFHVNCTSDDLELKLHQHLVKEHYRVQHASKQDLSFRVCVQSIQYWASRHLNSVALIIKLGICESSDPVTLSDILFLNRYARDFFDEFFRSLSHHEGPHRARTSWRSVTRTRRPSMRPYRQHSQVLTAYPASSEARTEKSGSVHHLAKPLSYCVIDALQIPAGDDQTMQAAGEDLSLWLKAGARSKTGVYKDDVAPNPLFGDHMALSGIDSVFQHWGSTKFALTPVGGFVLSLSHNHGFEVIPSTSSGAMMNWVEFRFLPIIIVVEFQRDFLLRTSRDVAATGADEKRKLIEFRNRIWFNSMTNDIQDERIWLEAKRIHGLDALFESVTRQVEDHSQFQLNKLIKILTITQIFIGMSEILTAIHPFIRPVAPLSYWIIASIATPLIITVLLVLLLQGYLQKR